MQKYFVYLISLMGHSTLLLSFFSPPLIFSSHQNSQRLLLSHHLFSQCPQGPATWRSHYFHYELAMKIYISCKKQLQTEICIGFPCIMWLCKQLGSSRLQKQKPKKTKQPTPLFVSFSSYFPVNSAPFKEPKQQKGMVNDTSESFLKQKKKGTRTAIIKKPTRYFVLSICWIKPHSFYFSHLPYYHLLLSRSLQTSQKSNGKK